MLEHNKATLASCRDLLRDSACATGRRPAATSPASSGTARCWGWRTAATATRCRWAGGSSQRQTVRVRPPTRTHTPSEVPQESAWRCASPLSSQHQRGPKYGSSPSACCLRLPAGAASPPDQPQNEEDPFAPKSDRDTARATAAVGVLGGQPTGTLQLLGDVKLREFFNDGGKVSTGSRVSPIRA